MRIGTVHVFQRLVLSKLTLVEIKIHPEKKLGGILGF